MKLTQAAINRPVFVLMLLAAAFLLGFLSLNSMRVELNPEVSLGVVTVQTTYAGASAEDINELISRKVEEAVSGVNGLRELTSTSQEGLSSVVVSLELGTNVDTAMSDVRSKVDAIVNQLPKDALKPTVSKLDISGQPVLYLALESSKLGSRELRDLIDDKLSDRFAQIPGVSSVGVQGGDTREIQVRISKQKLLTFGIGIADLQRALSTASANIPAGRLIAGNQEYTVRMNSQYSTVDQIRDTVLTITDPKNPMAKGKVVRLKDIADIADSIVERTAYSRLNGKDTIVIAIQKSREGNAVEITKAAEGVVKAIEKEYAGQDIKITKTFEQAKQITESIDDVKFALFFGVFLVAIIVYIFLHNFRGTLIVSLAIPTSIFATFIALNVFGFTINNMTMLALSLAVGVLVDDAIVVLENIYRHLKMGEDPRDAALNGRGEIGLAALAITFADVVVFGPIAMMGGISGQFFRPMAIGFVCATLFSLFVSFTLTPLLAARWYRAGEDMEHATGGFALWFEHAFGRLEKAYGRALEWALNHRWPVFCTGNAALFAIISFLAGGSMPDIGKAAFNPAAVGLFMMAMILGVITTIVNTIRGRFSLSYLAGAFLLALAFPLAGVTGKLYQNYKQGVLLNFSFVPNSDSGQVTANIELMPGTSLAETQKVVTFVEEKMKADPDVKYVLSNVGSQGVGSFGSGSSGSNYAQVSATLYDKKAPMDRLPWAKHNEHLRDRSADSVMSAITVAIGRYPGATIKVSSTSGTGLSAGLQLSFTSDNRALLMQTAKNIRERLAKGEIAGVVNPDITTKEGKPELQIIPDRLALADYNLDPTTLGSAVRTLYQGNNDTKLRVNGREYDVRLMMDLDQRNNPKVLQEVPVSYVQGNPVFIPSVAKVTQAPGVVKINRYNRAEQVQVTADLLPGFSNGSVNAQVAQWLVKEKLVPEGVQFKPLGQADFQNRESGNLFGALGIGLVLVYMLLASLYDNLLYPFIIQIAQPQAMVGALLALVLTDQALTVVGFIGLISLVGLVGKNAILLVDYTNTLRERGRDRHDALVEAGPTRLRPIMMTTTALILGMMPIALAIGRGSEFRQTIGTTIIGGITLSTFLTLLVIPCSYTIFDDLSIALGKMFHRNKPDA